MNDELFRCATETADVTRVFTISFKMPIIICVAV